MLSECNCNTEPKDICEQGIANSFCLLVTLQSFFAVVLVSSAELMLLCTVC